MFDFTAKHRRGRPTCLPNRGVRPEGHAGPKKGGHAGPEEGRSRGPEEGRSRGSEEGRSRRTAPTCRDNGAMFDFTTTNRRGRPMCLPNRGVRPEGHAGPKKGGHARPKKGGHTGPPLRAATTARCLISRRNIVGADLRVCPIAVYDRRVTQDRRRAVTRTGRRAVTQDRPYVPRQ